MGGGDLNSKKSWHPNTIKNQERVWKAEQAAAEEKRRIAELQKEHNDERDREELNKLAKNSSISKLKEDENQLHWMYNKPDKSVHHEDYLLGKTIDKKYQEKDEQEAPGTIRRVVGSSMLTTNGGGDTQVDLTRKLREDPLLLIKERERAARAALLNNPVQRRRLTEMLKKEQESSKSKKELKKSNKNSNLDNELAKKLNSLGTKKGIDLEALLASDSDSSSSDEDTKKKKKKKKKKKSKKTKHNAECDSSDNQFKKKKKKNKKSTKDESPVQKKRIRTDSVASDDETNRFNKVRYYEQHRSNHEEKHYKSRREVSPHESRHRSRSPYRRNRSFSRERREIKNDGISRDRNEREGFHRSERDDPHRSEREGPHRSEREDPHRSEREGLHRSEREGPNRSEREGPNRSEREDNRYEKRSKDKKPSGLSDEDRAAKLLEMAMAGKQREHDRKERVHNERVAPNESVEGRVPRTTRPALPTSLEARLHSNRHYIQRSERHMDTNFAKR